MSVEQADQTPENLLELDSSTLEEIIDALSAGGPAQSSRVYGSSAQAEETTLAPARVAISC